MVGGRGSTRRVAAFLVTGQSVVVDRLPRRGIGDELADARPDPRITIERSHPDADGVGVPGVAAEQRRATVAAKPFLATAIGFPDSKPVLAGDDLKRAGCGVGADRCRSSAATLAALAVAIAATTSGSLTSNLTAPQLQPPVRGNSFVKGLGYRVDKRRPIGRDSLAGIDRTG